MKDIIRFIGDVHGHYQLYERIICDVPSSVQLGDFGVGFGRANMARNGELPPKLPDEAMAKGDHRFIRGNHDNPAACVESSRWIPDGHYERVMFFVGGALSHKNDRVKGHNWWPDEEVSRDKLSLISSTYIELKPPIMVTHDCPEEVSSIIAGRSLASSEIRFSQPSRTRLALQNMWMSHPPLLWIFGHYHLSFDCVLHGGRVAGTRFICLAELEYKDIDVSEFVSLRSF